MPRKKLTTTEVVSKTATAPKATAAAVKPAVNPAVNKAAKPRVKAAVSTHKTRTTGVAPVDITAQQIADLAYFIWLDRGCPIGTSEEDWFRAESELRAKAATA